MMSCSPLFFMWGRTHKQFMCQNNCKPPSYYFNNIRQLAGCAHLQIKSSLLVMLFLESQPCPTLYRDVRFSVPLQVTPCVTQLNSSNGQRRKTKNPTVTIIIIIKSNNWISILSFYAVFFLNLCFCFETSTSQLSLHQPLCNSADLTFVVLVLYRLLLKMKQFLNAFFVVLLTLNVNLT